MIFFNDEELQACFDNCRQTDQRFAQVINADVGVSPDVPADGAYDLFRQAGSPAEIGRAVAETLETVDLFSGRDLDSTLQQGEPIYLNIKIRLVMPACGGEFDVDP